MSGLVMAPAEGASQVLPIGAIAPPVDGLGPQRQQTFQQSDHGLKSL